MEAFGVETVDCVLGTMGRTAWPPDLATNPSAKTVRQLMMDMLFKPVSPVRTVRLKRISLDRSPKVHAEFKRPLTENGKLIGKTRPRNRHGLAEFRVS